MNTQLKILLYIGLVVGILYYIQTKYSLFDISFDNPISKIEKKDKEEGNEVNSLEILNRDGQKIYVEVEVANTPQLRESGLSNRDILGDYQGMLFVFDSQGDYSFWMKDMLIPLDLIYIDYAGYIVDIREDLLPCEGEYCPNITANEPFMYVLEVNSGFVEINRVDIGNAVVFNISSEE